MTAPGRSCSRVSCLRVTKPSHAKTRRREEKNHAKKTKVCSSFEAKVAFSSSRSSRLRVRPAFSHAKDKGCILSRRVSFSPIPAPKAPLDAYVDEKRRPRQFPYAPDGDFPIPRAAIKIGSFNVLHRSFKILHFEFLHSNPFGTKQLTSSHREVHLPGRQLAGGLSA